jgi:DNA-binding response OmpR family regulator
LENEGHDVSRAFSAEEALKKLTPDCDLIMIDIMAGDKQSELDLIEKYHRKNGVPIIFLSELKPFIFKELFDHVKTVLKIDCTVENVLKIGRLHIDQQLKTVKIDDTIIPLTKIEYEIFYMFASNPLKPYSRQQIVDAIWKNFGGSIAKHTVNVHISHLRKKLGRKTNYIFNRPGFGYAFDPRMLLLGKKKLKA